MGPYFLPQQPPTLHPLRSQHLYTSTASTTSGQLCCPTEEIINNSLNTLPLTVHCDSPCRTLYVSDNNQQGSVKPSLQDFILHNCQYGITGLCQRCSGFKYPILVHVLTNTFYNHQHGNIADIRMVATPLTSHDLCLFHIIQLLDKSHYRSVILAYLPLFMLGCCPAISC